MGQCTSEYPCPKGIIPKLYSGKKKMKAGCSKGFYNEHRDSLRNLKDFTVLEYPSFQMKLRIKLICILSQKSTDIVCLGEL